MKTLTIDQITLASGGHKRAAEGMCMLEAAAYLAGEKFSDHPQCVSPVIASFGRAWNDALRSNEERDRLLKPLIAVILNTVSTPAIESRRAWMCADWLVREFTPAWLTLAKLDEEAAALRDLAEIVDSATLDVARPLIESARKRAAAAWAAAGAAAGDAAWDAAWDELAPTVSALQESAAALIRRMAELQA